MAKGSTPAMKQYYSIKEAYPESILFFRMGDFYEMFEDDALLAGKELGITVTSRNKNAETPIPLAGIPYHASEKYISILTEKGYSIALCEQVSDPKAKGIVQREVVEVITPATTTRSQDLREKENNFLASLVTMGEEYILSLLDLSTGEVQLFQYNNIGDILQEIEKRSVKEMVLPEDTLHADMIAQLELRVITLSLESNRPIVTLYSQDTLDHAGIGTAGPMADSIMLGIQYLTQTKLMDITHLRTPQLMSRGYVHIPMRTYRHLEIFQTQRTHSTAHSLFTTIDSTVTSGGGRLARTHLLQPLLDIEAINARHDLVELLYEQSELRHTIRKHLQATYDMERILARLSMNKGNARDLKAIEKSLLEVSQLASIATPISTTAIGKRILSQYTCETTSTLSAYLGERIIDEPPLELTLGGIIKQGVDPKVDEYRSLSRGAKEAMLSMQEQEKNATGIHNLRIKHNNVFGYFIEVSKQQADKVPEHYQRKQTLVNAERYVTPELQQLEERIIQSSEQLHSLEYQLFLETRAAVLKHLTPLYDVARHLAELDVLASYAETAVIQDFVRPQLHHEHHSNIVEGRHPVVQKIEQQRGNTFVANNTTFNTSGEALHLITGPNMGGKSTYLRQVAIISIMAQCGMFIPASSAELQIYDSILSRVGAEDNLSGGASTFMVEMSEMAAILDSTTKDSLLILDEIGRGTSTYDGLSLAQAIFEYLHNTHTPHTLFATHYHELIDVAQKLPFASNYSVGVGKRGESIYFLHTIMSGGVADSYGIEVAKLAGLPVAIIDAANTILRHLENNQSSTLPQNQPSLFESSRNDTGSELYKDMIEDISGIDVNTLTPLDAITLLNEYIHRSKHILDKEDN